MPRRSSLVKAKWLSLALLIISLLAIPGNIYADLLVANISSQSILRFSNSGTLLGNFVTPGSGGLQYPANPLFGPDGNLYVLDVLGNSVLRYNGSTGAFMGAFVPPSSNLVAPEGGVFGPDGNLYITGRTTRDVRKFNGTTGAFMGVFASGNLVVPVWSAFGPDGNLYVADEINVVKFNGATGAFMGIFVPAGRGGLSGPTILVFGNDGNLYVDSAHSGVIRYNGTTGALISQFVPEIGIRADGGLAFGPDGNLYVGYQLSSNFVLRYNGQTGSLIDTFIPSGVIGSISGMVFTPGSSVPLEIRPNHGGNAGLVTVLITGSGFQSGTTVKLTGLSPDLFGTNTTLPYPSALGTTFDLTGAALGVRNVVVTNPDNTSVTLPAGFTVEQGGAPQISVNIIGRDKIRIGQQQTYYSIIQNHGTVDASNVAAFVTQSSGLQTLVPKSLTNFSPFPQTTPSTFFGSIAAFSSLVIPFVATGPPSGFPTCPAINTGVHMLRPNDPCGAFEAAKAAAELYIGFLYGARRTSQLLWESEIVQGICFDPSRRTTQFLCDTLESIDSNLDSAIKSAEGNEQGLCKLAGDAGCPLNCNDPKDINALKVIGDGMGATFKDLKQLFLLSQIPLDQVKALKSQVALFETQALALPSALVFPPQPQPQPPANIPVDESASLQTCGVGSLDPNSKTGPIGLGSAQYLAGNVGVPYLVSFQNVPTATAPAQAVTVTDTLNTNLDLTTLTLGPISFLNQVVTPPAIPLLVSPLSTTVDLRPANNLLVKVTANLNTSMSVLKWTFQSLDPTTGVPPTDPLAGFLPPGAEGSVFFTVLPKSTVTTGTVIQNTATIVFDVNAPINTPTWSNTIDNTKPTSHVLPLGAVQNTPSFTFQWSGTDVGSGIQDYAIYVSDNGGPFTPWQTHTTATQGTFTGTAGHTYGFYSIARDLTGNVENAKTTAEATTRVVADTTPPIIVPQVSGTLGNNGWYRSNVTVSWSVTDPESGIASSSGCTTTTLTADTAGVTLTCSATNGAGLTSSVPITIKIDKTPPVISGMPAPGCSLWPPNQKMVQVATVTATDAPSGLAPGSFKVTGTSNEASDPNDPDIVITPSGSGFSIQLRADRLGSGTGRVYSLNATAMDLAGNTATSTATCTVPHDQGN